VAYPSYPAREQAFVKARSAAGDSARASRHRAMTYVFSGKPAESLKYFADAFRRCGGNDMRVMATEMVAIGVRGVQGHPINLDRCYQFMLWGPAGPDGKVGTPDDVLDPFQAMGVAAPAPATGGLAEMPPDQAKQLKDLMPRLEDMAEYWRQHYGRREAVAAVTRAHVAMCDWADPKVRDWYIREMLLSTQEYQTILMDGALGAAKGGQLHLVGVRQFHADLDAAAEAAGIMMPEWPRGRDVVKGVVDQLTKPQDLRPKLSPFPPPPPPPKK
jgi:hypothetical protein